MFAPYITTTTQVSWPPWVNVTCGPNSAMLLDMRGSGRWHVLNGTAAELMMLMKCPRSIATVGKKLAETHRIPRAVATDESRLFVQKMLRCGLLTVAKTASQAVKQEANW